MTNGSYSRDKMATKALESSDTVSVVNDDYISFNPSEPNKVGIIFYPGGKVEPESYAPLMKALAENNNNTFIAKMIFDLPILSPNAADAIISDHPEIEAWYLIGHSLGGVMACQYVYENDVIDGLILLASYTQDKHDLSKRDIKVLSILGSEDGLVDQDRINSKKRFLPSHTIYKVIEGGNHANMGFYGEQKGDNPATITSEKQMKIILEMIQKLIK